MVRRLMYIVEIITMMPIAVLIILAYVTFPIWILVWVIKDWWIYPWGNVAIHNLMLWFETQTTATNILGKHYTMEDYHRRKWDWNKQDWDD